MRNVRYILRLLSAFFARFRVIILIGIISGIAIFFLLSILLFAFGGKNISKIGIVGRYTIEKLPYEILNLVGDGLTQINEHGDVEPNLALSWETPDKGLTWIFTLKDDVFWQDKSVVKSQDVNYQFTNLSTEKPDEKTLVFKLKDPYSAFPSVVAKPIFKKGLLGTGEWSADKISLSGNIINQIILVNSDKDKVIYKFYPTEERAKLAFKLGEVNQLNELIDPSPLDGWKNIEVQKNIDKGKYIGIFFNTQDSLLSDKTTRQAFNYALDKQKIAAERALSPISENSGAYNPQVKNYNFDPEKAKSDIKAGTKITLTTSPLLLPVAEKIIKDWQAVGIDAVLQVQATIPNDYQALLAIFDIPEDPDQYSIWHSTQTSTNITKYSNPRIDKLLEDGRTIINLEERKKIYLDFQRFLVEDSPAIFLYYPTTYNISR